MSHEPDIISHESGSSRTGLYHCKVGQETVHDIVAKTTELFNHLKTTNAALQRTPENDLKRAKLRDILSSIQYKFDTLKRHYNNVNEICSSSAYVPVKDLIPYKDDPGNAEHRLHVLYNRRNLGAEPHPEIVKEKEELIAKIAERDEQLRQITNDLRDFVYEINTMLHISKS